jgi:hypothetical protein
MPSRAMPSRAVLAAIAVVVLLLIVLIARGCGDDALSAQELRSQAGAICVRATEATDRISVPNAPAGGGRFLREARLQLELAQRRLKALKAPDELRADYEQAVGLAAREVALIWRHEQQIERGGEVIPAFRSLQQQIGPVIVRENELWRTLDVSACVRR